VAVLLAVAVLLDVKVAEAAVVVMAVTLGKVTIAAVIMTQVDSEVTAAVTVQEMVEPMDLANHK
jgi:hypothetical protein